MQFHGGEEKKTRKVGIRARMERGQIIYVECVREDKTKRRTMTEAEEE